MVNNLSTKFKIPRCFLAMITTLVLIGSSVSTISFAAEDTTADVDQDQVIQTEEDIDTENDLIQQDSDANEDENVEEQSDESLTESEGEALLSDQAYEETDELLQAEELSREQNTAEDMKAAADRTDAQLGISNVGKKLDKTYRSFLIAGIDNGNRADIIIILSINKNNGTGKIFTVTRDTYMQIDSGKKHVIDDKARDFCKCNRAYEIGDRYTLMREINRHMDLNIREFIGVNWTCAAKLVDTLNSKGFQITGNITSESMLNAINKMNRKDEKLTSIGKKVPLKGWQAVQYLRVRKYEGGSATVRETRNRTMIQQVFNIGKKMTLQQATEVFDYIKGDLVTNMTDAKLRSAIALIATADLQNANVQIKKISDAGGFPVKKTTHWATLWDPDGHFAYAVPVTLKKNVAVVHKNVYGNSNYAPSKTALSLSNTIEKHRKKVLKTKQATMADAVIKASGSTYNGKKQVPKLTVKIGGRTLKKGRDYTVGSLKKNKNVGKATFKIKATGTEYIGSKKGSFKINPKGTSGLRLKAASGGFTAAWNKNSSKMSKKKITGYQIQYSTSKGFKTGNKTKTIKGVKKTKVTITKLKKNKTYQVRVRTYMKIGKKKYYSPWSSSAEVQTY